MFQDHLEILIIMSVEKNILTNISFSDVIEKVLTKSVILIKMLML